MTKTYFTWIKSPIGEIFLAMRDSSLIELKFPSNMNAGGPEKEWIKDSAPFQQVISQLNAYFSKELTQFNFPVEPKGTQFQQSVWKKLLDIPYGKTITYSELARSINKPKAVRAVGAANSRNPISIIIPCHRVIGADGKLTGYSGGLKIKERLLDLEKESVCAAI